MSPPAGADLGQVSHGSTATLLMGEIIVIGDDIAGIGIHIASRSCGSVVDSPTKFVTGGL